MTFYLIFLVLLLIIIIIFINKSYKNTNIDFILTQNELEKTIENKNKLYAKQEQKVQIVDELKKTIKTSNDELFVKIADMNNSLLAELYNKSNS